MPNQEITKKIMCIKMRDGIEIWEEEEKLKILMEYISIQKTHKFIKVGGNFINTADLSGIYTAQNMEDMTRRKNGQWQSDNGQWHNKGETVCKIHNVVIPFSKVCGLC